MSTEKDAMALAVLGAAAETIWTEFHTTCDQSPDAALREARAHLASRIAELEAERDEANERAARTAAQYQHEFEAHGQTIERAERAEAELAAVRDATCKVAEEMEACAQCSPSAEFYGMRFGDVMLTLSARLTDAARSTDTPLT